MAITKAKEAAVARPLNVLVPLIKEDLRQADDAAKQAGLPYYKAAGEKMLEAKPQVGHGEFQNWIKRNFDIGMKQAQLYMSFAEKGSAERFSSLADFHRQTSGAPSAKDYGRSYGQTNGWTGKVQQKLDQIDFEALRQQDLNRREERETQRQLALELIDIGYRVLASKFHPDRGGSKEAMTRLNGVRDRLKAAV